MKHTAVLIASLWLGLSASAAQAQWFLNPFRKQAPALPPQERVAQLIAVAKGDPEENKRANAVVDLRDFDTKTFPQIIDVLADVAQTDPKASVRAEAVSNLVRIRPVSSTAGQAIEHVATKDEHWRNRMNAQAALVRYRLAGYSSSTPTTPATAKNQTAEPPVGQQPPGGVATNPNIAPGPQPIIYHDQFGKVIPTPKGMPAMSTPGANPPSVVGVPASNNGGKNPFAPIPPSVPNPQRPAVPPAPVTQAPVVPNSATTAIEPEFRNVAPSLRVPTPTPDLRPIPMSPVPSAPVVPQPIPNAAPVAPPALGPALGPTLDLPPLPVNPAPAPTAPVAAPIPGPSLAPPTPPSLQPSGRMEPSPRLVPASE
jgi:hypothetical protein